jgi:hypothetical protein
MEGLPLLVSARLLVETDDADCHKSDDARSCDNTSGNFHDHTIAIHNKRFYESLTLGGAGSKTGKC